MVSCSSLSQAFFGGGGMILDDHEDIMGASHFNQQSWEFTTKHELLISINGMDIMRIHGI